MLPTKVALVPLVSMGLDMSKVNLARDSCCYLTSLHPNIRSTLEKKWERLKWTLPQSWLFSRVVPSAVLGSLEELQINYLEHLLNWWESSDLHLLLISSWVLEMRNIPYQDPVSYFPNLPVAFPGSSLYSWIRNCINKDEISILSLMSAASVWDSLNRSVQMKLLTHCYWKYQNLRSVCVEFLKSGMDLHYTSCMEKAQPRLKKTQK